jgi:hypothetical protein
MRILILKKCDIIMLKESSGSAKGPLKSFCDLDNKLLNSIIAHLFNSYVFAFQGGLCSIQTTIWWISYDHFGSGLSQLCCYHRIHVNLAKPEILRHRLDACRISVAVTFASSRLLHLPMLRVVSMETIYRSTLLSPYKLNPNRFRNWQTSTYTKLQFHQWSYVI